MTTIAYRNGVMAADTSMTVGDARVGTAAKIVCNDRGDLSGAAGSAGFAAAFRNWFVSGENPSYQPTAKSDNHFLDRGLIVRRNGDIEVYEPEGKFVVRAPYYAIGSGAAEARGAMFAGADAETAVRAAIAHDVHTGGDVLVLRAA